MTPALCLRMTVDDLYPAPMRLVAIDPDTSVGDLCLIIHAALGLEPSPPGHFQTDAGDVEALDCLDEAALGLIFTGDSFASYHPTAGTWDIQLTQLSETEQPHTTPSLIDATGPDLVSALGGVEPMREMLEDVRQLLAGLPIPAQSMTDIFSCFPNYTVDQVRQRLTDCFPPLIVQRLGELSSTDLTALIDADLPDPFTPFGAPLTAAISVPEMLEHTFPELLPSTPLPTLSDADAAALGTRVADILRAIEAEPALTNAGYFKPKLVKALAALLNVPAYWLGSCSREDQTEPIGILHSTLIDMGLIEEWGPSIEIAGPGQSILAQPSTAAEELLTFFPVTFEADDVMTLAVIFAMLLREDSLLHSFIEDFGSEAWVINAYLFIELGILEPSITQPRLTAVGHGFVGELLADMRQLLHLD